MEIALQKQMNFINLDNTKLINLSYSLNREVIRTNRAGSYASTTVITSNTRKYHGLLVCPLEYLDGGHHVLLSGLHETIVQNKQEFNLGIHKYDGDNYHPKGHKYLLDYYTEPISRLVFRIGGVTFSREMMLAQNEERIFVRYKLEGATANTVIRFRPYLAFRNIHSLSKANMDVITTIQKVRNGIRTRMYQPYPYLYLQFSKHNEFIQAPDWNYNIEYFQEQKRGYEYKEDLYTPGYFELQLRNNETVVFSAGTREIDPRGMKRKFENEIGKRIPRNTFHNCLLNSSQQFFVKRGENATIMSGFPWYNFDMRNKFGALPGLTLSVGDIKTFKAVIDTLVPDILKSLNAASYRQERNFIRGIDDPLWFIWALQQYAHYTGDNRQIWKSYGKKITTILNAFLKGIDGIVEMHDNGLLYCIEENRPRTWMNCIVDGSQVTPRYGYVVEINALWYNTVRFALEVAESAGARSFIKSWKELPPKIADSFTTVFWEEEKGYLADNIRNGRADWSVRPNQILAGSLAYSPLNEDMKQKMLEVVTSELLTPKGLRTLAPKNPAYRGIYEGTQAEREISSHQGMVYPWLLGHYAEAYFRLYNKSAADNIKRLFNGFKEEMEIHGIGTISELYDGDPPHYPGGAISYAWNVAELLRMEQLILYYKNS